MSSQKKGGHVPGVDDSDWVRFVMFTSDNNSSWAKRHLWPVGKFPLKKCTVGFALNTGYLKMAFYGYEWLYVGFWFHKLDYNWLTAGKGSELQKIGERWGLSSWGISRLIMTKVTIISIAINMNSITTITIKTRETNEPECRSRDVNECKGKQNQL